MKFSGKICLMIMLEGTKKQSLTHSLENTLLKKQERGLKLTPVAFVGLKSLAAFAAKFLNCS